jgi:hypothetical protein
MKLVVMTVFFLGLYVEGYLSKKLEKMEKLLCQSTKPPSKSYFIGLDPPFDIGKWKKAEKAACGKHPVLLHHVLRKTTQAADIYAPDNAFRWSHRLVDLELSEDMKMADINNVTLDRSPIVLFGRMTFINGTVGPITSVSHIDPVKASQDASTVRRKYVGIGMMDENWGWLSTSFVNR